MTAFIFSLMHLQFYGFLPRIILGVILGYLFVWSKNLWIPILIHFLNNALVVTFSYFFKENSVYQSIENIPVTPTFIITGLLSLGLMVYLLKLYQTKARVAQMQVEQ
jgi:membrane protease YdiL (CAAX protease family)